MSLKGFHIFFILLSICLLAGFGYWGLHNASSAGVLVSWLGVLSLAGAAGLAVYLSWFVRKSKDLPS